MLGAFFNGVLLFGLGISIVLQSIERFISLHRGCLPPLKFGAQLIRSDVENPKVILIVGCLGLGLNVMSAMFLHGGQITMNVKSVRADQR